MSNEIYVDSKGCLNESPYGYSPFALAINAIMQDNDGSLHFVKRTPEEKPKWDDVGFTKWGLQ